MSQMSVATTVAKRSPERTRRTSLRVITPEERAGSAWFPAMCVALLLVGLGAVLGLNTAMAQDSFEVTALEADSARLADTQDSLTQSINSRSAPQRLGSEAGELGMVPAGGAAFIDLDKGSVLGVATAAKKPDGFTVDAASTATKDDAASGEKKSSSSSKDKDAKSKDSKDKDSSSGDRDTTKSSADKSKSKDKPETARSGE